VGGVLVAARAGVHADPGAVVVGEAVEHAVVERHEVPE
jgi:ABC-type transporter Mla maintaining outer membrane lipid asymmetry permease subunit MlaE